MYINRVEIEGYRAAETTLVVDLPGRLSLLVGPNNAGKTTVCEAIHQAMRSHFPPVSRPPSDVVHGNAGRISLSFAAAPDGGGPLDLLLSTPAVLDVDVGRSRQRATFKSTPTSHPAADMIARAMSIYLPADRQPVRELAWENAFLIVQLLRTVANEQDATGDLASLYGRATELLEKILEDPLVGDLQERLQERMSSVAGGVATETPYVGTSAMDQRLLARILELLLGDGARETARRLELAGLGYANLLHLSAILTALPKPPVDPTEPDAEDDSDSDESTSTDQGSIAAEAGDAADGDIFPSNTPLFVLIIEEPEAHLHPQLHANVLSELRNLVTTMPTLQVIVSSHSAEIVGLAEPEEIIVLPGRRHLPSPIEAPSGDVPAVNVLPVTSITVAQLKDKLTPTAWADTQRMLRLHLDATRSAAIFARRVLLVEGPTDAVLFRQCGRIWAKGGRTDDERVARSRFIETLSIVAMNHKVGEWAVRLLATRGIEIAARVAVVRDSDKRPKDKPVTEEWLIENPPTNPKWMKSYDSHRVQVFELHPTLEPALWRTNQAFVQSVVDVLNAVQAPDVEGDDGDDSEIMVASDPSLASDSGDPFDKRLEPADHTTVAWMDWFFRFGPGHGDKGAFALLAADHARVTGSQLVLPPPLHDAFEYLWAGLFVPAAIPTPDVPVS